MEPAFFRGDLLFLTNDVDISDPIRVGEVLVFNVSTTTTNRQLGTDCDADHTPLSYPVSPMSEGMYSNPISPLLSMWIHRGLPSPALGDTAGARKGSRSCPV